MSKHYLKCAVISAIALTSFADTMAQQTLTGRVSDAKGNVSGVSVAVKGTTKATQTDLYGNFNIAANPGETLRFTAVGYKTQEIVVGNSKTLAVSLTEDATNIEEVVVTAMGIKREKRALGYSFQEVKGEQLTDAKETNIANALVGKVSGLQVIKGSSGPASSSKLTLRGNNSLTGDNQPLIIVDGVPVNNFLGAGNNDFWNPATDMGSGLGDLNPEDIESMSVLKSGAASALYGSRAGNGAIVITTKSGRKQKGSGITFSSTLGLETLFLKPDLQNSFGQGRDGIFNAISTENWGPKIEGQEYTNWKGQKENMKAYDNIDNFFNTGINHIQNIAFQQQVGENTNIYTSATYLNDKSKIPGASLQRINLMSKINTTFGPNKRWNTDIKVQYMNTEANNRPISGQNNNNVYSTLFRMPRSLNILDFENPLDENKKMQWYGTSNSTNPYWLAKYRLNEDTRDRFLMNGNLKYALTDWLDAEARFGSDRYTTNYTNRTYGGSPLSTTGQYSIGKSTFFENNYIFALHARKDNLAGKWGGSASVFGQIMNTKETGVSVNAGQLEVPDLFTVTNGVSTPGVSESFYKKQINSLYATAELNYDNYWFINFTGRNDWSSALGQNNRSFFYPSVSTSLVLTDLISKNGGGTSNLISFAKIRGSYAAVGNDLRSYQLFNVYNIGKDPNSNTTASRNTTKFNPDVVSELIKTVEFGANVKLFNNRLDLDFAWYKTNATNQLLAIPLNPLSGYSSEMVNAGNIQNKGIEITANAGILTNPEKLTWNLMVNFSKNRNTIVALTDNVKSFQLGGFDNLSVRAIEGQLYGEIYGTKFLRVADANSEFNGQLLLTGAGLPQATAAQKIGNQAPKALVGITNSFAYKNFGFSFQVDGRIGGEFFSGTNVNLQANGSSANTVVNGARENMVLGGVIASGTTFVKNDKSITPQQYWTQVGTLGNLGISEANLYDATNFRLRNVNLNYNIPIKNNKVIQRAKVGLTVNNVWMIKSYAQGIDPESVYAINTNAVGFENFSTPTSRSYFFNLTLGF
ncbi:SusC/RagA family TonB-linked outer membrane protein [Sphingobacteriaceae bacterium WQ 2009]|uniref:SusC/RagA family TonB-linked outer membrane protein n=1 Tax=Rhinopithecimicrobium faecis TaxID=2820698 RepID=A0A8T4H8P0_9SPHI|nr:SusC/RagA family TonB-linked outer membrane protein [Sphingobacteriaceae bacterium WQ 2009]